MECTGRTSIGWLNYELVRAEGHPSQWMPRPARVVFRPVTIKGLQELTCARIPKIAGIEARMKSLSTTKG